MALEKSVNCRYNNDDYENILKKTDILCLRTDKPKRGARETVCSTDIKGPVGRGRTCNVQRLLPGQTILCDLLKLHRTILEFLYLD